MLAGYLHSYTTALSNQRFRTSFIDGFAGTGYRERQREVGEITSLQGLLFPDIAAPEPQKLLDGSARIALQTQPRFDRYIFIERNSAPCSHLEELKGEFPSLANDILIFQGDANQEIQRLCQAGLKTDRAVFFLDLIY